MLSPSRPVSVLIIQAEGAGDRSFYLTTALGIGTSPPFKTDVVTPSRVTPASFEKRSRRHPERHDDAVDAGRRRADAVRHAGRRTVRRRWAIARRGTAASRRCCPASSARRSIGSRGGGGTLGYLDHSHPIFDEFKDPQERQLLDRPVLQVPRADARPDRQGAGAIRRWRRGDGGAGGRAAAA